MSERQDNHQEATAPLLVARNLAFSYAEKQVFSGVSLSIAPREIVCLVGASGCGKSTLLRLLAGLEAAVSGTVEPEQDHARRSSSFVFQSPALLPWLSVEENVAFGLDFSCRTTEPQSLIRERTATAIEQVGLSEHAQKHPYQLSGGMAQRVALARAFARDPEIIFLDEPFSALDAITRESMQDLLIELAHRRQAAAMLVTHDLDEALRIGDRVLLLGGSPAKILGEWTPEGRAPRQHRSSALNAMREEILDTLSEPATVWYPNI